MIVDEIIDIFFNLSEIVKTSEEILESFKY